MATVIGLDLGNFNSYPSFIEDLDMENTRLGGKSVDLLPAAVQEGVPSVFFYNGNGGFLAGRAAVSGAAKPERNRIRYLKRSLGEPLVIDNAPVVIDGKAWTYDDAIREVVQSVLREANTELHHLGVEQTNLISLAYPATYSCAQRERLIQVVESATAADGTNFKVIGTIMEPAAAALDYLVHLNRKKNTTVLVFDLGGGTFDLSLVTCYPQGIPRDDKHTAYYDIHLSDGLPRTGGCEFDDVVYHLLRDKLEAILRRDGHAMTVFLEDQLRQNAEKIKKELSDPPFRTSHEQYVPALDDTVELELTREEFENAPRVVEMLTQMTGKARELLANPNQPRPDIIVLTGGSCRMPMIREALIKALPEYAKSIESIREYNPEKAISYGAARYGAPEAKPSPVVIAGRTAGGGSVAPSGDTVVIKRLAYDIGIHFIRDASDSVGYIVPSLTKGTALPCETGWIGGHLAEENTFQNYSLYEANTLTPDVNEPMRDYRFIKSVKVLFGNTMPVDTRSEVRLLVNQNGLVTMEARKDGNSKHYSVEAQLENLN